LDGAAILVCTTAVFVLPELVVCLECGNAEFSVPKAKLRLLGKANGTVAELAECEFLRESVVHLF